MLLVCTGPADGLTDGNCRELFQGGALLDMKAATATAEVAAALQAMSCVLFSTAGAAAPTLECTAAAGAGEADAWPAPGATFNSIMEQMHVALPDMGGF